MINPFLHDRMVPCSKGPYLATFRRSVRFVEETRTGLRDKEGYDAFLKMIAALEKAKTENEILRLLRHMLYKFVELRDSAAVTLSRVQRLSLDQHERVISALLSVQSGGLLPVLLSVAMFRTIKQCFDLDWEIEWQGINVADVAARAGGDITIKRAGSLLLAVEITERVIDRSRIVSAFNTKISPHGIDDYLFFFSASVPTNDARAAAQQYFAQGHDISFLPVKDWLVNCLGTIGHKARSIFTKEFVNLLDNREIPAALKVAWNDRVKDLPG